MARLFSCDKCDFESIHALDVVVVGGKELDLCAPCRADLGEMIEKTEKHFLKKAKIKRRTKLES